MQNHQAQVFRIVDIGILALSALGVATSLILGIIGVMSVAHSLNGVSATLGKWNLFIAVGLGFAFLARYQQLTRDLAQSEVGKLRYYGCPKWMRLALYACLFLGVFLFFLPGVLELMGWSSKSDGTTLPSTLPGGFGLLAYSAYFAQLYSIKVVTRNKT